MKIKIDKENLLYGLQSVIKAVNPKTTLAVLKGVELIAENEELHLRGTCLDIEISSRVPAIVEEPGRAILPAKELFTLIKSFQKGNIAIYLEGDKAVIKTKKSHIGLNTFKTAEFPQKQSVEGAIKKFSLKYEELKEALLQVLPAVAKNDNRPILTGLHLSSNGNEISFVATDSFRLAWSKIQVNDAPVFEIVVPANLLAEITRINVGEENITIAITERQITFQTKDTEVMIRLLSGNYPNFSGIIPQSATTAITAKKETVEAVIERCLLMADSEKKAVIAEINDRALYISAESELGSCKESIEINKKGEDLLIAFNPFFLKDGLKAVEEEESVILSFNGHLSPIIIKGESKSNFLYLLLPIKIDGLKKTA